MAQLCRISEHIHLQSSADKFYEFIINKTDSIIPLFPQNLGSYEVLQGNGFTHGSITRWKYDFGRPMEATLKLLIDKPNKSVVYEILEGDVLKDFQEFKVKVQVLDNGTNNSAVNWSLEYVKANEDLLPPHNYLKFGVNLCKGLDAYLCKN